MHLVVTHDPIISCRSAQRVDGRARAGAAQLAGVEVIVVILRPDQDPREYVQRLWVVDRVQRRRLERQQALEVESRGLAADARTAVVH